MATAETRPADLTATDVADRFGPIPLRRIVLDPPPGTATEDDVIAQSPELTRKLRPTQQPGCFSSDRKLSCRLKNRSSEETE